MANLAETYLEAHQARATAIHRIQQQRVEASARASRPAAVRHPGRVVVRVVVALVVCVAWLTWRWIEGAA